MKLTAVLQGEPITMPITETDNTCSGYHRVNAPVDGFSVDLGDTCAFLSRGAAEAAMCDLKFRLRDGRRRRA